MISISGTISIAQEFKQLILCFLISIEFLNYQVWVQPINWFDLTPPPLSVLFITLLSTFPHKIQPHNLLQRQPPLKSRRCNRHSLVTKRLKIIDVPIQLSCHFSVWTKHKGTLEPKLEILIYMQDQYLSAISSVSLSPTQSHNIKVLFKCDIWIGSQTRITAVGNRGFTNTLQN